MTAALITIDTELSPALYQRACSAEENYRVSIAGQVDGKLYGIEWQMDEMDRHGLKGVFFVDPLSSLVYGNGPLRETVSLIRQRDHEIGLHVHTEWLKWAEASPTPGRNGASIKDFSLDDQITILKHAIDLIVEAGAERPISFRAGNYGANDDTLTALAEVGIVWDSSFNPTYLGETCAIGLPENTVLPVQRNGIIEIPISGLIDQPGRVRHTQVCALSSWEMASALEHAAANRHPTFVAVTHSFEMLSRNRKRRNRVVTTRFSSMCRQIRQDPRLRSTRFLDLDPLAIRQSNAKDFHAERLKSNKIRTTGRIIEQMIGSFIYER